MPSVTEDFTEKVLMGSNSVPTSSDRGMLAAINNLSLEFRSHVENTEKRLNHFEDTLSTINFRGNPSSSGFRRPRGHGYRYSGNTGNYTSNNFTRGNTGNYTNNNFTRGNFVRGGNRNPRSFGERNQTPIQCFKCNGLHHMAKNCLSRPGASSGN